MTIRHAPTPRAHRAQLQMLLALPTDEAALVREWTLGAADLAAIGRRRRDRNRLGFALQLCALRFPGRLLRPGEPIPAEARAALHRAPGRDRHRRLGIPAQPPLRDHRLRPRTPARGGPAAQPREVTAEAWLRQHPGISIVSRDRDRGGGYGEAMARALPDAVQVADRWHLMENASAAFLDAVRKSMRAIRSAVGATTIDPALLTAAERLQYEGFSRREEAMRHILTLKDAGHSIREIVRRTRHSRKLVRQAVRDEQGDVFRVRQSSRDAYLPALDAGWALAAIMALNSGGGCRIRASEVSCASLPSGSPGAGGQTKSRFKAHRGHHRPARRRG